MNSLKGTLSSSHFSNISNLIDVDLSHDPEYVVSISANFVRPFQLYYIDLWLSNLGSLFPSSLSNVQELDMSENMIHGKIADTSISLQVFPEIDLSLDNDLYGSYLSPLVCSCNSNNFICSTIAFAENLSYNSLTGQLSHCIENHFDSNLVALILQKNNFIGGLGLIFKPLSIVETSNLDLSSDCFSGSIPRCIYNLTAMSSSSFPPGLAVTIPTHANMFGEWSCYGAEWLMRKR
ncbi:LOW QUALITY PROTEIN: hypothetical protein Cgig2_013330 [Carnegiea gigantea]|uniref:Uncharacterized protein n=1 Tax=Carnegiea gigantea TaxID=171969 RepID=A0A9Q1GSN8_9CARY|nr:LOW QUALITY PROTEIN: hypothetical protein Cgig2_013330 [Carnegiea gigantea]